MLRVVFTHLYVIVVAIFVVATGNMIADHYGPSITRTLSNMVDSVDDGINDASETVSDWNKKILN
jgi:hypothetical protein